MITHMMQVVSRWCGHSAMTGSLRVMIAACVLAASIVCTQLLSFGEVVALRRAFHEFPLEVGPYRGLDAGLEPEVIKVLGVSDFMMRQYVAPAAPPVWLYVGYYESQRTGAIIHSPQQCLPGGGWSIVSSERVPLALPGVPGPGITVNRVIVAKGTDRQVVLYWYQERGRIVASEYWGKLYLVWDSITRSRSDGALVRVSAPVGRSADESVAQLAEFSQRLVPLLTQFLPE